MSSNQSSRRVLVALLVVMGSLAIGVAGAGADAADPVLTLTTGTIVAHADGSMTVTVQGAWVWPTHKSDCNQDKRAVGFAVDWSDPQQPGNVVATLNGRTIAVGTAAANAYNGVDSLVHHTGAGTDSRDPNAWRGTCGTFNAALGYNSGTWGPISHTYSPAYTGPITICALMYDVHLKTNGGAPNGVKEITAGGKTHNGDNSAESNQNTPLGNGCFQATITPPPPNTPLKPALALLKTERIAGSGTYVHGPITATVGQNDEYRMIVTNTVRSRRRSPTVNDPVCDAGTLAPSGGRRSLRARPPRSRALISSWPPTARRSRTSPSRARPLRTASRSAPSRARSRPPSRHRRVLPASRRPSRR